jgi:serine phosphatase RsbU (regulator of sigma subunit)
MLLVGAAGQQRTIVVSKLQFTIGRGDQCDVIIADSRISRLHATLVRENGEYFILDAGSRHGTFVNGVRCARTRLNNKDQITLGIPGIKILFVCEAPGAGLSGSFLSQLSADSSSSDLEKLKLFLEAARSLSAGGIVNDVLRTMLEYALKLTQAERAFLYIKQEGEMPALLCSVDSSGQNIGDAANVSQSVIDEALTSASEFIVADTMQQSALAMRESIVLNELRTVIAIPLHMRHLSSGDTVGVLYLDSRGTSHSLSGVGHEVLRALASQCTALLESARLAEVEQAARQHRQEMQIAASIQRSLLSEPEVQCDFARASGCSLPCKEVGGDFFDVYVAPDSITVVVVDVSGKGISAALLASGIHGMFYAQLSSGTALVDAIASINKFLCSRVAGQKYATLLAAQLHRDGTLDIVNCGHVPATLVEGETVTQATDGDLPLGLIAETQFHVIRRKFARGGRLCIITDGISEAQDPQGTEFGLDRVQHSMSQAHSPAQILEAVASFCGDGEPQDDCTVIVLERTS